MINIIYMIINILTITMRWSGRSPQPSGLHMTGERHGEIPAGGGHCTVSHPARRAGRCAHMGDLPAVLVPAHTAGRGTARCQPSRLAASGHDAACFEAHRHAI